jgi:hypothetical protein
MLQWPRSPPSHPKKPRFSNSVSSRSVFARRCSRDTATLERWITCASTPRASSQRASQKPSRPASKATAIRVIVPPAWTASSRQRCSTASSRSGLGSSFLCGCRSIPGTTPPRSQLDWLSSTTEMIVLFWSRATRDLLKFGWGIAALHRLHAATKLPRPRRPPHSVFRSRGRQQPRRSIFLRRESVLLEVNRRATLAMTRTQSRASPGRWRGCAPRQSCCGRAPKSRSPRQRQATAHHLEAPAPVFDILIDDRGGSVGAPDSSSARNSASAAQAECL